MDKKLVLGMLVGILFVVAGYFVITEFIISGEETTLQIGNSPIIGDINAPITIYEFTDFSCPYCAAAEGKHPQIETDLKNRMPGWEAPMPLIKENYVKTGKVKIVFKYYPGHGTGLAAHAVALAVHDQNPEIFQNFTEKALLI